MVCLSYTIAATTCDYIGRATYDGHGTVVRFYYDFGRRPDLNIYSINCDYHETYDLFAIPCDRRAQVDLNLS